MNEKVKISKLAPTLSPPVKTPLMKDYVPGADNGDVSLPVEYWIEGILLKPITVGKPVAVFRTVRNGVEVTGYFTTGPVVEVTDEGFKTANSIYSLKFL